MFLSIPEGGSHAPLFICDWSGSTRRRSSIALDPANQPLWIDAQRTRDHEEVSDGDASELGFLLLGLACLAPVFSLRGHRYAPKISIHVAEYLTTLPPRSILIERLQQATRWAQLQIEQREDKSEKG